MDIKSLAHQLGFAACGIAKAAPVEGEEREKYLRRVEAHRYADMDYMYRNVEKRLDPTLLVPGTKSIISVALNYAPAVSQRDDSYKLAAYALGKDYHDIMKRRLRKLATTMGWQEITMKPSPTPSANADAQQSVGQGKTDSAASSDNSEKPTAHFRVFVDSAPVLERYWAQKAGLGWIGRNNLLIIPHAGTMFFLGEIFVDIELDYDTPAVNRCGRCTRCIDACPTGALKSDPFDASLCLSYQTIENRGEISEAAKSAMDDTIYGCDRCQAACPWNRFATPNDDAELQPSPELLAMSKSDWQNLDVETYRRLFKGSAVKRAKYEGLMRNIKAVNK